MKNKLRLISVLLLLILGGASSTFVYGAETEQTNSSNTGTVASLPPSTSTESGSDKKSSAMLTTGSTTTMSTEPSTSTQSQTENSSVNVSGANTIIDPTNSSLFEKQVLPNYPLGVATPFTAFAAGNLTFGNTDSSFDGTYGGKEIGIQGAGDKFFQDAAPDSDEYPIRYNDQIVTLVGETIQKNLVSSTSSALSAATNFHAGNYQYSYVLNDTEMYENKTNQLMADGKSVSLAQLQIFQNNFGSASQDYFTQAKKQLSTVSNYYQALTSKTAIVWNDAVKNAELVPTKDQYDANKNELSLNIALNEENEKAGAVVVNLDYNQYKDYYYHLKINLTGPKSADSYIGDQANKNLPFIIFNWENWETFSWPDSRSATITYTINGKDANDISGTDGPFYQKMGGHILHNFPDITGDAVIQGRSGSTDPFVGTIFVPYGNIQFPSSNSETSFWGGLIAGGNISLDKTITKGKAFGSLFDTGNLPDITELLPGIHFREKIKEYSAGDLIQIPVDLTGPGIGYAVSYELLDLTTNEIVDTWEHKTTLKNSMGQLVDTAEVSRETNGLKSGRYQLKATIKSWTTQTGHYEPSTKDTPIFDTMEVDVKGTLTLDAVPNLAFQSTSRHDLMTNKIGNYRKLTLVPMKEIRSDKTFDGNNTGTLAISDNRMNGDYRLSLMMDAFEANGKTAINSEIPIVLSLQFTSDRDEDKQPIVPSRDVIVSSYKGEDSMEETIQFNGKTVGKTTDIFTDETKEIVNGETRKETIDPASALYIGNGASIDPGTYHATLTWTLTNAPD